MVVVNKKYNQDLIEELVKTIKREKNKIANEMTNRLKGDFPRCCFGWETDEVAIKLSFELKDSKDYRLRNNIRKKDIDKRGQNII